MEIQFCRAERVPFIKPKFMSPAGLLSGAPTQGQTVLGQTHKSQPQSFWMDLCAGQGSPPSGRLWWEDPKLQSSYKRSSKKTTGLFIIQLSKSCRESHGAEEEEEQEEKEEHPPLFVGKMCRVDAYISV